MDSKCYEHAILSNDLVFLTHNHSVKYRTWEVQCAHPPSIVSILFVVRSSKADRDANGRYLYLSRNSTEESVLLDEVILWCKMSGVRQNEPFLSRHKFGRHKKLTRRMVTEALRATARTLGFDAEMVFAFTPHSMRIGGCTTLMASGSDREKTKRVGGWGYDSTCDRLYQLNTILDDGALAVTKSCFEMLSVEHVHKLIPPTFLREIELRH